MDGEEKGLVEVRDLSVHFPVRTGLLRRTTGWIKAVDGISLTIKKGETVGLVGESGSGKSTAALTVLRLRESTTGQVLFQGQDLAKLNREQLRSMRRKMQMVFQDPYTSLNPYLTVGAIVAEPLVVHRMAASSQDATRRAEEMLELVGVDSSSIHRFPAEFSGGQQQRIAIARALSVRPDFLVCDEPVSALDVSIQAQILNLLRDLQSQLGVSCLFISHGLHVVRYVADRIAVMYLGKIVEVAPTAVLFQSSRHPYTRALLSAVPIPDPRLEKARRRIILRGDIPSVQSQVQGCRFRSRCPMAVERCAKEEPPLIAQGNGQMTACWRADDVARASGITA